MSFRNVRAACVVVLALASSGGCAKHSSPDPATNSETPTEQAAPEVTAAESAALAASAAKTAFSSKCVVCHGTVGLGDGPGAAALTPKPRAFSDATWQASVTDEQIGKTIVEGGAAVGKSPNMPPNPDLADKPEVVKQLVGIVRAFKKG
jgi:cytochrome c553